MPQLIVALPAYNEEPSLPPLLQSYEELKLPAEWQMRICVVNDGSSDGTADVVRSWADKVSFQLELIDHEKNKGLGEAIKTGLRAALERAINLEEDVVVCMDADNTHHPRYIISMLEKLEQGADLVIASRYQPGSAEHGVPPMRRVYSRGARLLFAFTLRLPGVRDYTCGYRAYRLNLIQRGFDAWGERLIEHSGFACTDELLVKLGRLEPSPTLQEIPFELRYDLKEGRSKLPLFKTILQTLKLCFSSRKPPHAN